MQRERGNKNWKNFSKTYRQAFSKNQQVPQKYSTETMSKLATVVYLILPT